MNAENPSWSNGPNLPYSARHGVMYTIGDHLYMLGGYQYDSSCYACCRNYHYRISETGSSWSSRSILQIYIQILIFPNQHSGQDSTSTSCRRPRWWTVTRSAPTSWAGTTAPTTGPRCGSTWPAQTPGHTSATCPSPAGAWPQPSSGRRMTRSGLWRSGMRILFFYQIFKQSMDPEGRTQNTEGPRRTQLDKADWSSSNRSLKLFKLIQIY